MAGMEKSYRNRKGPKGCLSLSAAFRSIEITESEKGYLHPHIHAILATDEPIKKELPKAIPEDVQQAVAAWNSILQELPGLMKGYLKSARLTLGGDNVLMVVLEDERAASYLNMEEHKKELEDAIARRVESQVDVRIQLNETNRPFEETYVDLKDVIHMDITIEDE